MRRNRTKYKIDPAMFILGIISFLFMGIGSCSPHTKGKEICESVVDDLDRQLVTEGVKTTLGNRAGYQIGNLKLIPSPGTAWYVFLTRETEEDNHSIWISYEREGAYTRGTLRYFPDTGEYRIPENRLTLIPMDACATRVLQQYQEKLISLSVKHRPAT
jgi:hypothetical protein